MCKKVIFCGDIGVNIILETKRPPDPARDHPVVNAHTLPGGSAANTAAIASHFKIDSYYMGLIADDIYQDLLLKDLKINDVKLDLVKNVEGKNTLITTLIHEGEGTTFYSYRGVNGFLEYGPIQPGLTESFDCVHISGYCLQDDASRNTALRLIEDTHQTNTLLSFAPSIIFSCSDEAQKTNFISNFNIVIPNLEMAQCMTGEKYVVTAAKTIRNMGPKMVIIKMGKDGCFISYEDTEIHVPTFPAEKVINTLGAGDAFCGAFLASYLNGMRPEDAAKVGNAAAVITIHGSGGHDNMPTKEKLKAMLPDLTIK